MTNTLVCPKCAGVKHYYVFNYDERKRVMLNCDYCKATGEVDIDEKTIRDIEKGTGIN
jgi:hypothetical protein